MQTFDRGGRVSEDFDAYVSARGKTLLRFAQVLTADAYLAEDLVQEVLARAHRKWTTVAQAHQIDQYLRKAIVNQYLSWRRLMSFRERPMLRPPERADGADHEKSLADRDAMRTMLSALPRKQRAVLVLRFYEDLDDQKIAELLSCSVATVRSHASKALARLRTSTAPSSHPLESTNE